MISTLSSGEKTSNRMPLFTATRLCPRPIQVDVSAGQRHPCARRARNQPSRSTMLRGHPGVGVVLQRAQRNSSSAFANAACMLVRVMPMASVTSARPAPPLHRRLIFEKALEDEPWRCAKRESMPKGGRSIDHRTVPNPVQARTLLRAVSQTQRSGLRSKASFAVMYSPRFDPR